MQALFALMILFTLFRFLGTSPMGRFVLWSVLVVALLGATVIWMNRNRPATLATIYRKPGARQFIDFVCKVASEQPPIESAAGTGNDDEVVNLLLQESDDFGILRDHILCNVFGFEEIVPDITKRLERKLTIRRSAEPGEYLRPLGSLLLAAPTGTGRRFLADHFAVGVYRKGICYHHDLRDYSDPGSAAALTGSSSEPGSLVSQAIRHRHATFVFENLSSAHSRVLEFLSLIITQGFAYDSAKGRNVRFQDALFFFLEAVPQDDAKAQQPGRPVSIDEVSGMLGISESFLSNLDCLYLTRGPSKKTAAKVVLKLMRAEAFRHNRSLPAGAVEPSVVALAAKRFARSGFAGAPAWVSQVLEQPLCEAAANGSEAIKVGKEAVDLI